MRARAASVAAIASLLLIAGGVAALAARTERHQLGTNLVKPVLPVAELRDGDELCQRTAAVPAGTGGVVVRADTGGRPGPGVELTVRAPGQPDVRGSLAAGRHAGYVVVPVPRLDAARRDARICLEARGPGRMTVWGGPSLGRRATVDGERADGTVRLEYVEPTSRSWYAFVPDIGDRLAAGRDALPGPLALPLFALLALVVVAGSVVLVAREGRR